MTRPRKHHRFNAKQLQIDWSTAQEPASPPPASTPAGADHPSSSVLAPADIVAPDPPSRTQPKIGNDSPHPDLVQVLPWDFVTTFPEPMEEAIGVGLFSEEDASAECIKAMHAEISRQLLNILCQMDEVANAHRLGVDPKTKARPTSQAGRERLKQHFKTEPAQLERNWQAILGTYEAAFGTQATEAFDKAIRACHAGVRVVADITKQYVHAVNSHSIATACAVSESIQFKCRENKSLRVIARLPVPRPLPQAVKAGHFGQDEQGPVNPSPDEVRAITLSHAEELIDLLADVKEAQRRGFNEAGCKACLEKVDAAISKYAEDFGGHAGEQLLAYCRRQLLVSEAPSLVGKSR